MHHHNVTSVQPLPADKSKIKKLWTVAGILGIITAFEFAVAFLVPHEMEGIRVWTFVIMTIVKAAYIVGEFMHLSHERKSLFWSIVLPLAFVVWLLVVLAYFTSADVLDVRY